MGNYTYETVIWDKLGVKAEGPEEPVYLSRVDEYVEEGFMPVFVYGDIVLNHVGPQDVETVNNEFILVSSIQRIDPLDNGKFLVRVLRNQDGVHKGYFVKGNSDLTLVLVKEN